MNPKREKVERQSADIAADRIRQLWYCTDTAENV